MNSSQLNVFDGALAGTLFPRLLNLANLSTTSSSSSSTSSTGASDVEARAAKLELNKQASQLRTDLATLQMQAKGLEAGDMSLEDQDWLILELEKELGKKCSLIAEVERHSSTIGQFNMARSHGMETAGEAKESTAGVEKHLKSKGTV